MSNGDRSRMIGSLASKSEINSRSTSSNPCKETPHDRILGELIIHQPDRGELVLRDVSSMKMTWRIFVSHVVRHAGTMFVICEEHDLQGEKGKPLLQWRISLDP